jgi:hypothetical protein
MTNSLSAVISYSDVRDHMVVSTSARAAFRS